MQSPLARRSAPWPEVLASVELMLAQAVAATQQREQALVEAGAAAEDSPAAWRQALAELRERITSLEDRALAAGAKVAATDAALAEGESALRAWLQSAGAAAARLATHAGSAVG